MRPPCLSLFFEVAPGLTGAGGKEFPAVRENITRRRRNSFVELGCQSGPANPPFRDEQAYALFLPNHEGPQEVAERRGPKSLRKPTTEHSNLRSQRFTSDDVAALEALLLSLTGAYPQMPWANWPDR